MKSAFAVFRSMIHLGKPKIFILYICPATSLDSMVKHNPPPAALSIKQILDSARSSLIRLTPAQLSTELDHQDTNAWGPTILIDIRPTSQRTSYALSLSSSRSRDGPSAGITNSSSPHLETIPSALIIERNVLEWRIDPQSDSMHPGIADVIEIHGYDARIVIFCQEGYTSSLAAYEAQRLGLRNATDLEGGYKAWCEANVV